MRRKRGKKTGWIKPKGGFHLFQYYAFVRLGRLGVLGILLKDLRGRGLVQEQDLP